MSDRVQSYESPELTVTFDPKVCTHSATCVRGLAEVFDVKRKPWIAMGAASAAEIEAQVGRCPSGALAVRRKATP